MSNSSAPMAIILAAGKSTRMKSELPKVLHPICGRPMIEYVLDAVRDAGVERIVVVVGHKAEQVRSVLSGHSDLEFAVQSEQHGTGHAVMMCDSQLTEQHGPVLVLAGDTPLLSSDSLRDLLNELQRQQAVCVIGSAITQNNYGLGRIVRDANGDFCQIVEERDATEEQRQITEINTGCYAFETEHLRSSLHELRPDNSQAEYYLTDCPAILLAAGQRVAAAPSLDIDEAKGVNTRAQLADVEQVLRQRHLQQLMIDGVTIIDPISTYIDLRSSIGRDSTIWPFTTILGASEIGASCNIGPQACIDGATIADGGRVSPFEHITGDSSS